jgi:hypothetical protein
MTFYSTINEIRKLNEKIDNRFKTIGDDERLYKPENENVREMLYGNIQVNLERLLEELKRVELNIATFTAIYPLLLEENLNPKKSGELVSKIKEDIQE